MRVGIIGVGMTAFRPSTPEYSWKELMFEAASRAYADAGINPRTDVGSFITCAEDYYEGFGIFDEFVPDQLGAALRPTCTISGDGLQGLATAFMQIQTGLVDVAVVEAHSKASDIVSLDGILEHGMDPIWNRPLGAHPYIVAGLEATAYHHDYRDQIAYTVVDYVTFEGTYVNLAHTRARGLELSLEARPTGRLLVLGQYTYLDGEILESPSDFDPAYAVGQPLLRRPEHQGSLTAQLSFPRWNAGATIVRVGCRTDSDFVGLGLTTNPAYTRLDARLRVRIAGPVEAFLVAENLLDALYQETLGYPALGRSVRGGLRVRVGGGAR